MAIGITIRKAGKAKSKNSKRQAPPSVQRKKSVPKKKR